MGTFWAENYSFIKDVYDSRAQKMSDLMDAMDKSIGDILADKIYTSAEFKKVKEIFMVRLVVDKLFVFLCVCISHIIFPCQSLI